MSQKKVMECVSYPVSNRYFERPYEIGEKVIYLGEVEPDSESDNPPIYYKQFIRIKRLKPMEDRVEFKKNFEFVKK